MRFYERRQRNTIYPRQKITARPAATLAAGYDSRPTTDVRGRRDATSKGISKMERVAPYLRSTKDRHDVSVEAQRRELAAHAESKGYVTTVVFEDKVQSAKTDDRPGFQDMIAEAGRPDRRFDVILCLDTSRFARNATDAKLYKNFLRLKCGVRVEFVKLPTTDSYVDPLIETLMEGIDQLHSQKSKADGLRGMRENVLNGFRAGGIAPIGYMLEKIVTGTRGGAPVTKSRLIR